MNDNDRHKFFFRYENEIFRIRKMGVGLIDVSLLGF